MENVKAFMAYLLLCFTIFTTVSCLYLIGNSKKMERELKEAKSSIVRLEESNKIISNELGDVKQLERILRLKEDL